MSVFIEEISLVGFKSFSEKTTVKLGSGLNMIVGPNGCGKSNIIDAFCWTFGESHVKNLRSSHITDVIFAGTQKKNPSFLAKVSFKINNSQRKINYDSDSIHIKRQVNRDGESEFYINNIACRLKDIQQLFLDTGLGRSTYSILQQGRVDQIITGKSEDRRILIEEAAGIRYTKTVIKESQSKLARAQSNLERVEDIISEVYKQYLVLEEQANKALKFREVKEKIQDNEKNIFFLRFTWIRSQKENFSLELEAIQQTIIDLEKQLKDITQHQIDSKEELMDIQVQKEELFKEHNDFLIQEGQLVQKIDLWKKEYKNIKEKIQYTQDKRNTFTGMILEKQIVLDTLQNNVSLEENKVLFSKKELEYEELLNNLNELEVGYQNWLAQFVQEDHEIHSQAIEKILEQFKEKFLTIEPLKKMSQHQTRKIIDELNKIYTKLQTPIEDLEKYRQIFLVEIKRIIDTYTTFIEENTQILLFFEQENKILKDYLESKYSTNKKIEFSIEKNNREQEIELLRKEITVVRTDLEKLKKKLDKEQEVFLDVTIQKEKILQEIYFFENTVLDLGKEIVDLEFKLEEYQEFIDESFKNYETILKGKEILEAKNANIQEKIEQMEELKKSYSDEEEKLQIKIKKFQADLQKLQIDHKGIEIEANLLLEEFEHRYIHFSEQKLQEYQEKENLLNISTVQLQQKLKEITNKITKDKNILEQLGMVNFLAIEEFQAVSERYNLLISNKEDILKGKADLSTLIQQLLKESEEKFLNVFEQVNNHLKDIFSIAFNGGKCSMELTNKENPLDGGIEIIAQPPGKKLQNLNLLSGGEKTMVALSILFSLFMVKPAPFCLMDEVDAALDEMNIERFLRIVNQFKDRVQFLIITHNRNTAQKGDVFYGVTMQETGISKVFSFLPDNNFS